MAMQLVGNKNMDSLLEEMEDWSVAVAAFPEKGKEIMRKMYTSYYIHNNTVID